jgi:hypothetical protein
MRKPGHTQSSSGVPDKLAQMTPQDYISPEHSFTLQAIMEMKGTLGELTQAIKTLTEESRNNRTLLSEISHKIYAAEWIIRIVGGLLSLIGAVAVWLFWNIWSTISPLVQVKPHP